MKILRTVATKPAVGLVEPLHKSQGLLGCWKRDENDDLDRLNDAGDVDLIMGRQFQKRQF